MVKSTTIAFIVVFILVVAGLYFFINPQFTASGNTIQNSQNTGSNSGNSNGNVQRIVLSYKNYNYYPQTITVKANQPVSISLDSSVKGCYRYLTIRDLGLSKSLSSTSDTLDFTPTQKGTYRFACGMGMGYGTLVVE